MQATAERIPAILTSLLLPLTLQGSAIAVVSDAQLCSSIESKVAAFAASIVWPITAVTSTSDCPARLIHAAYTLSLSGDEFESYVTRFVAISRTGVCNPEDAAMTALAARGWRFAYRFTATDGTVRDEVLTC